MQAATDLASDRFIAYSTWKWIDLHGQDRRQAGLPTTSTAPGRGRDGQCARPRGRRHAQPPRLARPAAPRGAVHSAEIEYAMGNLDDQ